jgi:hypothetical protein
MDVTQVPTAVQETHNDNSSLPQYFACFVRCLAYSEYNNPKTVCILKQSDAAEPTEKK